MFIYIASSPIFREKSCWMINATDDPHGRLREYLADCPPMPDKSQDVSYDALWETSARTKIELLDILDVVNDYFMRYRLIRRNIGDSDWFNFKGENGYDIVKRFMDSRPYVKHQVQLSDIHP